MRASAERRRTRWRTRRQRGLGRLAAIALPLTVVACGLAVTGAVTAAGRADHLEREQRALRLQAHVWEISRAQLRETNLAALDALGFEQGERLARARAERVAVREAAREDFEVLGEGDDPVASLARTLLGVMADQRDLLDRGEVAPHHLWDTFSEIQETADRSLGAPGTVVFADLTEVALVPAYVLSDAIDLEYVRTRPAVRPAAADYFRRSGPYIESGDAGWLAPDPDDPFSGRWVPREAVRADLPDVEAALTEAFTSRPAWRVVALDRWVQSAPPNGVVGPPPEPLGQAAVTVDELGADLQVVVDGAFADRRRQLDDAAASEGRQIAAYLVLAGVVLVGGSVAWVLFRRRRQRRLAALTQAAETDGLTGLANRRAIQNRVPPRLADPERAGHVVLQLDFDRFKSVNDTYGHRIGDELLLAFAGRAEGALERLFGDRPGDRELARVGGDEFLIVLHDSPDPVAEADALVTALEEAFTNPLACGPVSIPLDVSGGVATADGPCDLDRLLLEADIALYQAKDQEHVSFRTFDDPVLRDIMRDFPGRVASGAVRADLQPQVDLASGEVVGAEALARWWADGHEAVPAALWIAAVEQLGGTDLLFQAVTRSVAESAHRLGDRFRGRFWINLSPLQLGEPDAAARLLDHLAAGDLAPDRVGLEVLETASLNDLGVAARNLEALRDAGVAIALDDFGAGFTPLGHLTALPIDRLKLDRTVVAGIDRRPRQAALVEATVTIADKLGLELVAEGIETAAERDTLARLGVRLGQGYHLGHPGPVEALEERLSPAPAG